MQQSVFTPLYHGERLRILNPEGDVGFITYWSPIPTAFKKMAEADPVLASIKGRIAVVGNLYGDGMFAMFCNLLNNPQIRHLVSAGQDLAGCAKEIEAFLQVGTEPISMLGKPMRRVVGTSRYFPEVAEFDEASLRKRLTFKHFGQLSVPDLPANLREYVSGLASDDLPIAQRVRVEIPQPGAADFSYLPSNVGEHQVTRRRPLECWRELVVRTMRFGRPVTLKKGVRLELQNTKVVIGEPVEESADQLAAVGFDLERFQAYQKKILDPLLPENISYTYGNRLRGYFPRGSGTLDSLQVAIEHIRDNPESRHAYVSLWDTSRDLITDNESDSSVPCLTTIFFRASEGKLALFATYRSHNLLTAWLENVYGLMAVQRHVASALGMPVGAITVISHSLGADPSSTRFEVGRSIAAAWDRDDDVDPSTGKPVLRNDPHGYFALSIDEQSRKIIADHLFEGVLVKRYEGERAEEMEAEISADMAISLVSHAMWLGRELARNEAKLKQASKTANH